MRLVVLLFPSYQRVPTGNGWYALKKAVEGPAGENVMGREKGKQAMGE